MVSVFFLRPDYKFEIISKCVHAYSVDHGILQARILEWIAIPLSKGSFQPGIEPESPVSPALQAHSLPTEPPRKPYFQMTRQKKKMLRTSSVQGISENMKVVRSLHMVSRTVCS